MAHPCQPDHGSAVEFSNVTVARNGNTILDKISAKVPEGSCTAIIGPNGAGKTTMLLTLLGEVHYAGNIQISCMKKKQRLRIGYVPQRIQFDRGMPLTVLEFMVMGWQRRPLWLGVRKTYRDHAEELLTAVEMGGLESRKIGDLSGGEMQRMLLALALGQKPDILVLDEPASGVDCQGEYVFCELLRKLRKEEGFTQLMVSHDLPTVTHHATHVICLNRRVIAEGTPRDVLTTKTLTALFGMHMGLVDSRSLSQDASICSAPCCIEEPAHG